MMLRLFAVVLAVCLGGCTASAAQSDLKGDAGRASAPGARRAALDPETVLSAIVKVKVKALPDARSNASLGAERDGSGVVIDDEGHILTIGYIVMEPDSIEVITRDNRTVPAVLVAYDHATGFGLLKAEMPLQAKPLPLGDSDALSEREPVMVISYGGVDAAQLAYVVSRRRFAASWEYLLDSAIFTSPPAASWAGAALLNRDGQLIGIGSLLVRDAAGGREPVPGNMFVPIDSFKPIAQDLIARGRRSGPTQPWFGLTMEEVRGHVLVTRVLPESPGAQAGLHSGDIVVAVSDASVQTLVDANHHMWQQGPAGTEIGLRVLQGSELHDVRVKSIDRNDYFKTKPGT